MQGIILHCIAFVLGYSPLLLWHLLPVAWLIRHGLMTNFRGRWRRHPKQATELRYSTLSVTEIASLPVQSICAENCHRWLWTTNRLLETGCAVLRSWGLKYLTPFHWIKPNGFGPWVQIRSTTIMFGYKSKRRMRHRYRPNVILAPSDQHSQEPECSFQLIESCRWGPYIEVFGRRLREGWTVLGDEIDGLDIRDLAIVTNELGQFPGC
jgi:N6-adenosine-specific RNA methylase IME4